MKIIFVGGGTAGHVNPAIAIAEEIRRKKDSHILFIGREGGGENIAVKEAGIPLKTIKIQGLKRSLSPTNIKRIFTAFRAKDEAEKIIEAFSPDVVIGTGGYVCYPVIRAAQSLKIPTFIHESNIFPGLTTKLLSRKCSKVLLNYSETKSFLPKSASCVTVGNPLRKDFFEISREGARERLGLKKNDFFILSFGGSIGAERLNEVIIELMDGYCSKKENVRHIHSVGKRYYESIGENAYKIGHKGCKILPYIENMPLVMRAADVVICRCGAVTLSEISLCGLPSILIPSPNVTNDHQRKNAEHFEKNGAAIMIEEKNLCLRSLKQAVEKYERDGKLRIDTSNCIKKFATKDSAQKIAGEIFMIKNGKI